MGTGFSYTSDPEQEKDYLTDMNAAAGEFVQLMKNLYATFPELASKPLYMTGESYAGKYIPKFSYELLQQELTMSIEAESDERDAKSAKSAPGPACPSPRRFARPRVQLALREVRAVLLALRGVGDDLFV